MRAALVLELRQIDRVRVGRKRRNEFDHDVGGVIEPPRLRDRVMDPGNQPCVTLEETVELRGIALQQRGCH